ncbi:MAG TPA: diguanylate cyclase [Arenimonas sp.]|nr:diguanylate cyclase [Arenimonas sp.]
MLSPHSTPEAAPRGAFAASAVQHHDGQADDLRAELLRFRQDLGLVPQDYQGLSEDERQLAYQRLNLAAAQAARIAETAMGNLDQLVKAAQRDPLTDTPNRTLMLDRMGSALMMARRRASLMAVMFLDLDHFKQVNDSRGHAHGDEVLRQVARRLESVVRDSDTVSRFGGDEFVVLLPEIAQASDAGLIAAKMLEVLSAADVAPDALDVRASIGISLFPDDGDDVAGLLERADVAMYRAKKTPGSSYVFHSEHAEGSNGASPATAASYRGSDQAQDMRQANERLVLSVLGKETPDGDSEAMHARRVRFLAMVAHELRHPLAPIRTAADLVRHASGDAALLERMHQVIEKQVTHMARLVDDLLDETRVGGGRFRMESVPVDVAALVRQVAEDWRTTIAAKQQSLAMRFPEGGLWVRGDGDRLAQVFVNLLDNANRYTPDGGSIRLLACRVQDRVVIRVSDTGMGLPQDILECIFDLFARGPEAMAVHKGGLGIGLAVARELVEAHGGEISAHSFGEDRGSRFEVTLPRMQPA